MRAALFILSILISGCKVIQPVQHTEKETVREYFRDTVIQIPGASTAVILDSAKWTSIQERLNQAARAGKQDTVWFYDSSKKANLKFYLDALGHTVAECESSDQKLTVMLKEIERLKELTKTTPVIEKVNPWWMWPVFAILAALLIIQSIKKL